MIVDIYYDHFLAKNWEEHSARPLVDFSQDIYALMKRQQHTLPFHSARFTDYMIRYNILENYKNIDAIEQVLLGMSRRARFKSNMEQAGKELVEHFDDFEKEFNSFFPELKAYVKSYQP